MLFYRYGGKSVLTALLFAPLIMALIDRPSLEDQQTANLNAFVSEQKDHLLETASISGKVQLPAESQQRRVFRGSAYRGRQGSLGSANAHNHSQSAPSPLLNTIISAHPLSFKPEMKTAEKPKKIFQNNAAFDPHVTPVMVGSTVQFINKDSFFHNVFSLTPGARFNIGRRPTGDVYDKKVPPLQWKVEGLGEIEIFCDIHSQMNAFILSLDTPYFTRVQENGSYNLIGLPAGKYELRAYNPQFDVASIQITLTESQSVNQNFNIVQ